MKDEERFQHLHHEPVSVTKNIIGGVLLGGALAVGLNLLRGKEDVSPGHGEPTGGDGPDEAIEEYQNLITNDYNPDLALWGHPASTGNHKLDAIMRARKNPEIWKLHLKLVSRWASICRRSRAISFCPTLTMPRSISGDIAGPPELLEKQMDKIEKRLKMLEQHKKIEGRWLEA